MTQELTSMQPPTPVDDPAAHPRRLHVFDMDGTLLRGASTIELARHFGKLDEGLAIEQRWLADEITEREFWQVLLDLCGGATDSELDAAFHGARWMPGVAETFADIRSRGEIAIVISQSPIFFVRRLQQWGVHETYGSALEIDQPFADGATIAPEEKVSITAQVMERHSISPENCVAYGDSSSDLDLFRWLPNSVAVNSDPVIAELATDRYLGEDIREAYEIGRRLLTTTRADRRNPLH
ncbi:HAD family hydrolase [Gordonia jinghuaiqii]|uniref:HAD family hydrolase n=1 Tax=Gordonia jinghuaiqii TaxID=2758710 RepID=UPI001CB79C75|nr:HAD-IB family phosphatase [Gordonia jinghuaiqii]